MLTNVLDKDYVCVSEQLATHLKVCNGCCLSEASSSEDLTFIRCQKLLGTILFRSQGTIREKSSGHGGHQHNQEHPLSWSRRANGPISTHEGPQSDMQGLIVKEHVHAGQLLLHRLSETVYGVHQEPKHCQILMVYAHSPLPGCCIPESECERGSQGCPCSPYPNKTITFPAVYCSHTLRTLVLPRLSDQQCTLF